MKQLIINKSNQNISIWHKIVSQFKPLFNQQNVNNKINDTEIEDGSVKEEKMHQTVSMLMALFNDNDNKDNKQNNNNEENNLSDNDDIKMKNNNNDNNNIYDNLVNDEMLQYLLSTFDSINLPS